jgi:hypothetical protein
MEEEDPAEGPLRRVSLFLSGIVDEVMVRQMASRARLNRVPTSSARGVMSLRPVIPS